jgi:hypothetical protein
MNINELYTIINAKRRGDGDTYNEEQFLVDISVLQFRGVITRDATGDIRPVREVRG